MEIYVHIVRKRAADAALKLQPRITDLASRQRSLTRFVCSRGTMATILTRSFCDLRSREHHGKNQSLQLDLLLGSTCDGKIIKRIISSSHFSTIISPYTHYAYFVVHLIDTCLNPLLLGFILILYKKEESFDIRDNLSFKFHTRKKKFIT